MNENCLVGWKCPKCGSEGPFYIDAVLHASILINDDGTMEEDVTATDWDDDSRAQCYKCDLEGVVSDFHKEVV